MAKYNYTRVCPTCGDTAEVSYKPKAGTECLKCSASKNAYKMSQDRRGQVTRYTRTCVDCGDIKEDLKAKPKEPQRCANCSRGHHGRLNLGKIRAEPKLKKPRVRKFRICHKCGDTKEVSTTKAAAKTLCGDCSRRRVGVQKKIDKKPYNRVAPRPKKPRVNKVSKEAIARAKQLNKEHREKEASKIIVKQKRTDEQMTADWLAKHEVTVIVPSTNDCGAREVRNEY